MSSYLVESFKFHTLISSALSLFLFSHIHIHMELFRANREFVSLLSTVTFTIYLDCVISQCW